MGTHAEVSETEPNDRRGDAQPIGDEPTVINGRLASGGDVDTFAVDLDAGETLVAEMAAYRPLGSPMDAVLQVVTPSGTILLQEDDSLDFDPRVVFTAPASGTFLLRAFCFPADPNSTIDFSGGPADVYRLTVSTGPFARYALPHAVERDAVEPVIVGGWNMPATPIALRPTPSASTDTAVVFDAAVSGVLNLPVVPHQVVTRDALRADDAGPRALEVPVTVSGVIAPAESSHDYTFRMDKDAKLAISVASRSFGSPLDAVLQVRDAAGKQVAKSDDVGKNPDPALEFTAPEEGVYVVSVGDLHRRHDEGFFYNLTLTMIEPSYRLSVASDRFTLKPDEVLEIPVTVERLHGFAEPIEVSLANLSGDAAFNAAVTAEPVTSAAEGDTAKSVTLKLNSSGQGHTGNVQIIGTSAGDDVPVTARATIEALGITVSQLWLTALPAAPATN
ncbi:MAG: PPC domain-containing protein [Pirellulales bacterium]